jgi:hypothetical protein
MENEKHVRKYGKQNLQKNTNTLEMYRMMPKSKPTTQKGGELFTKSLHYYSDEKQLTHCKKTKAIKETILFFSRISG